MPFNCTVEAELSSHISRKNAIIAVMKSAYASFHAPPWWPFLAGADALDDNGAVFVLAHRFGSAAPFTWP